MKKTLLIVLIIALCLCICACGNDKENASKPDGGSAQNQTPAHTCSGKEWVVKEEPSCVKDGTKEQLCDCGKVAATEPIPATGHSFLKGICEVCGAEDPDYVPGPSEGLVFVSQGDGTCYVTGIGTCTDEDLWIPETSPNGETVVRVATGAFAENVELKTLTIPATVTRIDNEAFKGCTRLQAVYGCESLKAIGKQAFRYCAALAEFPASPVLTGVEDAAFHSCTSLKSFTMPAKMKYIRQTAFYGCTALTEITIPGNVHTIESSAFRLCSALREVSIESGVVIIDSTVFADCTALEKLTLGEGLESIRKGAFYNCQSLTEVVFPASLDDMDDECFAMCTSLKRATIQYSNRMIAYDSQFDFCPEVSVVVPDEFVEDYRNHTGWSFYDIRSASAPDITLGSVGLEFTSNRDGTCYVSGVGSCTDREIVIPEYSPAGDRVTKIGASAFEKCADIRKIVIPNSVTEIGAGAFMDCSRLESLEIPESVTVLGGSMIYGCHKLTTLTIRSTTVLNYPEPPMHWEDNTYERMNVIYVPAELVEEYRNAYGWAPFGEKIQAIAE